MYHTWHDILKKTWREFETQHLLVAPSEFLKAYQWLLVIKTDLTTETLMSSEAFLIS